jgi:hypothetical protein
MKERMVRINATLTKELLHKIQFYAQENMEDNSTAIRQLVAKGLLVIQQDRALQAYQEGRVTLREAAKIVGLHPLELQDLLMSRGIPIQDLQKEELQSRIQEIKEVL